MIKVNLPWMDIVNLINSPGGWRQRYGIQLERNESIYADPPDWWKYGGMIWRAGNSTLYIMSESESTSTMDLMTDHVPADKNALSTWRAVKELLAGIANVTEISASNIRTPFKLQYKKPGRRVDSWNPIAFDILQDGNERRAFEYWCDEQGIENPTQREKDAFRKAMERQEKRVRTN